MSTQNAPLELDANRARKATRLALSAYALGVSPQALTASAPSRQRVAAATGLVKNSLNTWAMATAVLVELERSLVIASVDIDASASVSSPAAV